MQHTDQTFFDTAVAGLLKQRARSETINERGFQRCLYRGPNGLKCAVGHAIPDEEYWPGIEGTNAMILCVKTLEKVSRRLMVDMQRIHDREPITAWPWMLIQVAAHHHLRVPRELYEARDLGDQWMSALPAREN